MNWEEYLKGLEGLEIQYWQPKRETISHDRLLESLTFKATRIAFCLRFCIAAMSSIET